MLHIAATLARHRFTTPRVRPLAPEPTAHGAHATPTGAQAMRKPCGHRAHVGTCGACQRAALATAQAQLAAATAARIAWAQRATP
jgi:hypothetical protein